MEYTFQIQKESFEEIELCKFHSNSNYDNDNDDDN